jgi:CRP-like cAMP-binding protein
MEQIQDHGPYEEKIGNALTFKYLTASERSEFLKGSELLRCEAGEKIIGQGDINRHIFALVEGEMSITAKESESNDVVLCSVKEGEVVGESAIFMTVKATASVVCTKPSVVMKIHRKSVIDYFRRHPHAGNKILMLIIYSLLDKLRTANIELANEKQSVINLDDIDQYVQDTIMAV